MSPCPPYDRHPRARSVCGWFVPAPPPSAAAAADNSDDDEVYDGDVGPEVTWSSAVGRRRRRCRFNNDADDDVGLTGDAGGTELIAGADEQQLHRRDGRVAFADTGFETMWCFAAQYYQSCLSPV